jgi:hypothetical protein
LPPPWVAWLAAAVLTKISGVAYAVDFLLLFYIFLLKRKEIFRFGISSPASFTPRIPVCCLAVCCIIKCWRLSARKPFSTRVSLAGIWLPPRDGLPASRFPGPAASPSPHAGSYRSKEYLYRMRNTHLIFFVASSIICTHLVLMTGS